MALDKAIRSGKEHRRPYRGSKAFAGSCRNHGGCEWCRENRTHKMRDKEDGMKVWTMGYVGDGWEVHDTEDERTCENCQYWDGHSDECRNPESDYYESTRHGDAGCDEWKEWRPKMEQLKPCPFCGGEAVMETFTTSFEKHPRYRVRCTEKGCRVALDWDWFEEKEALEAWNRRAEDGTASTD